MILCGCRTGRLPVRRQRSVERSPAGRPRRTGSPWFGKLTMSGRAAPEALPKRHLRRAARNGTAHPTRR